jgi:uncharacterized protein YyaL (SSP411 family)
LFNLLFTVFRTGNRTSTLLIFSLAISGCGSVRDKTATNGNQLGNSLSPYLQEHADNPVAWHEWNDQTLKEAKEKNKPLLVSIGYAACHWCHVMEEESFMDTAVANLMNRNFMCIKVDREERPDIDQIYVNASELLNGSAGWPLNAFALPDGQPFYVGTYFPKPQWKSLLQQVDGVYREQHATVLKQAASLTDAIVNLQNDTVTSSGDERLYDDYSKRLIANYDLKTGGIKGAPKFPMPTNLDFLLAVYSVTNQKQALDAVTVTLDNMAMGGIYDHLGGGFARYATDGEWNIPHFEKMLYDNAQLISAYSHAFQVTGKELYRERIKNTITFLERELRSPEGAFYSSINADSEGEEGKFYAWTKEEILKSTKNGELISNFFSATAEGNWENNKNILQQRESISTFASSHKIDVKTFKQLLDESTESLLKIRNQRIRPTTDTKIITSWNALMIIGYLDAYNAMSGQAYLNGALKAGDFISQKMIHDQNRLWHNYSDGKNSVEGFLDDYALTAKAFIKLYEATFDISWLQKAKMLADFSIIHFQDSTPGLFYFTADFSETIVARKKELIDHVVPSSNSVMADVLFRLGEYYQDENYSATVDKMLAHVAPQLKSESSFFSNWATVMMMKKLKPIEIAIVGENAVSVSRQLRNRFNPLAIYMGGAVENLPLLENKNVAGQTIVYVCQDRICRRPVTDVTDAMALIQKIGNGK